MEHDRFLHEIKHLNVYIIYMTAVNIIGPSDWSAWRPMPFPFQLRVKHTWQVPCVTWRTCFVWDNHLKACYKHPWKSQHWTFESQKIFMATSLLRNCYSLTLSIFHPTQLRFSTPFLKSWPLCLWNLISRHFFSQFWPRNVSSLEPMKSFVNWMIWATTLTADRSYQSPNPTSNAASVFHPPT